MTDPPENAGRSPRIRILDQGALATLLRKLIQRRGSQVKLAEWLGIEQTTISKLLRGERDAMSFSTYAKLLEHLGGDVAGFGRTGDPVLEFSAEPLQPGGEARTQGRADDEAMLYQLFKRSVLAPDQEYIGATYEIWLDRELAKVPERVKQMFKELWQNGRVKRYFQDLFEEVTGDRNELPGEHEKRAWLAAYRILQPLAHGEATLRIETDWKRLGDDEELRAYLRYASRAEAVLLRRAGSFLVRLQDLHALEEWEEFLVPEEEWDSDVDHLLDKQGGQEGGA